MSTRRHSKRARCSLSVLVHSKRYRYWTRRIERLSGEKRHVCRVSDLRLSISLLTISPDKWSQPKDLYMTVIICSLAAAVQGWDQTGSNGANLSFPTEFGIPTDDGAPNREHNEWIVGTINAGYVILAIRELISLTCSSRQPLHRLRTPRMLAYGPIE